MLKRWEIVLIQTHGSVKMQIYDIEKAWKIMAGDKGHYKNKYVKNSSIKFALVAGNNSLYIYG